MQRRSGEKTSHMETIINKGIKFSPLQAGSRIGLHIMYKAWRLDIRKPISYGRTSQNAKSSSAKYLVRKLPDEGTCVPCVQNGGIHGL